MKQKLLGIITGTFMLAGGTFIALGGNQIEDCPLQGTPDCPIVKTCPLKDTPECPLITPVGQVTAIAKTELPPCCRK